MSVLEPARDADLRRAKLRALVGGHVDGDITAAPITVRTGGAGLIHDGAGWFLPGADGPRALGAGLAWAASAGADRLHLVTESSPAVLARRAAAFDPAPTVWAVEGRTLREATAVPPAAVLVPAPSTEEYVLMLRAVDVDVVVEHGVVTGEVEGLEIARVLVDDEEVASIEIGVGRHDREAFALLHRDRPTVEALAEVADAVRRHRRPGAAAHPLNRLAASRRLRSFLQRRPELVGAVDLVPVPPAVARTDLRDDVPAASVGRSSGDEPIVVVASVGIDLDLVPEAADVRAAWSPQAGLRLVLPERDVHARTVEQAARLARPAEIVTVPDDWHAVVR